MSGSSQPARGRSGLRVSVQPPLPWLAQFDQLPVLVWQAHPDGWCEYASAKWLALPGRTLDGAATREWAERVHPEDLASLTQTCSDSFVDRRPFRAEYRLRRNDGEYRWVLDIGMPYCDGAGAFAGYVGYSFDITDLKAAREAAGRYQVLAASARDALLLIGPDGSILEANPAAERMYGYSRQELRGLNVRNLRAPEALYSLTGDVRRAWTEGLLFETMHCRKDGSHFAVEVSSQPAQVGGRRVLTNVVRELTDRFRMKAEVEASRSRQQLLFVNAREGVAMHEIVYDGGGAPVNYRIVDINPAFCTHTGLKVEDVEGRLATEAYGTPEPPYLETYSRVVATGQPESFETYFPPLKRHFSVSAFPLGGGQFATVFANISDRKKMDEQYRQAQKMEAVGRLAGGVAHDFNNLLTVILGYSDVLLDSMEPDDPLRECVDSIRQAGQRASRLTSQLLAFGRRQLLQPQVLDLNAIVSDTGRLLTRLIGEDIALATVLDPGIGAVRADAGQITQMIMNLAVNARDAMPKGGQLTIETANVDLDDSYTAIHPGVQPGPYVMLAVTDTGTGMSPEVLSHLFEPFFTTKPKGLGTGLGLSMVYGIVKQSGGDVHVYSEVGRGTTFKIYLPRIAATAAAESVVPEPAPASRGETILFVEDDADVAVLVRSMLRDLGYDVLAASNGAEALHICAEHRGAIDLLLTDVVMPGLSGLELADSIRSRRRIPVLYISGYPGGAAVQHSIVVDRDCFIQKPFTAQALGRKIREVLDRG